MMLRPSSCSDRESGPQLLDDGANSLANLVPGVLIQCYRLIGVVGPWDDRIPCPAQLAIGPECLDVESPLAR